MVLTVRCLAHSDRGTTYRQDHLQSALSRFSTNVDLLHAAADGAPEGIVRVAHFQNGGRGRLDRSWSSPPGAGLTFSVLLRPAVPTPTWGWLPLLAGVALAQAVGADAKLKWPNDVL